MSVKAGRSQIVLPSSSALKAYVEGRLKKKNITWGRLQFSDHPEISNSRPEGGLFFDSKLLTDDHNGSAIRLTEMLNEYAAFCGIKLAFRHKGENAMPDSGDGHEDKPDIRVSRRDKGDIWWTWSNICSVGDYKVVEPQKDETTQLFRYGFLLHYNQPHRYEHHVLCAYPEGYIVYMIGLDAVMVATSTWDDVATMKWYMERVYDFLHDERISLDDVVISDPRPVRMPLKLQHNDGFQLHALPLRFGLSERKNCAAVASICSNGNASGSKCVVVKMQNKNSSRSERDMLAQLKDLPGVVKLSDFQFEDLELNLIDFEGVRYNVVLDTIGEPLSTCRSFGQFLRVVFDLIETHRRMVERRVLHRDPSWTNVYLYKEEDRPAAPPGSWYIENLLPSL